MKKLLFVIFILSIALSLTAVDTVDKTKTKNSCCGDMKSGKNFKMMNMHKNMQGMHGMHMKMHRKAFSSYISVQSALATDDLKGAKSAFGELSKNSEGDIKKLSDNALKSGDLKGMRTQFKELSKLMATSSHKGYGTAYCPMAKAWWVQKDGKIKNPYFGKKMLDCGSFKEFKKEKKDDVHQHHKM